MNESFKNTIEKEPLNIVEQYEVGSWESVKDSIMSIENKSFGGSGFGEDMMKGIFEDENNLNYILKDSQANKVIGYVSVMLQSDGKSAYIMNTAIAPEHQGKGNVGLLMQKMEDDLKSKGVEYLIRDAAVENGYADKIERHYVERIIEDKTYEKMSPWGLQRHFEIKL